MNIIKPNAQLIEHNVHPYAFIEKVGRTCYKSEDKITPESAVGFVKGLAAHKHGAMLEHEDIYLAYIDRRKNLAKDIWATMTAHADQHPRYAMRNYMKFDEVSGIVMASFRTWMDFVNTGIVVGDGHGIQHALHAAYPELFPAITETCKEDNVMSFSIIEKELNESPLVRVVPRDEVANTISGDEPSDFIVHTVLFTCDRGVSHEFVRHRPASFGQESTRYCNYTKGQFGEEITVIEPFYWNTSSEEYKIWKNACKACEKAYFELIEKGATPQEARSVLPNSLKTEIFITATEREWQHIVNLRCHGVTGKPHPQMVEVMKIAYPLLVKASNGRIQ
jgi:hypothetical protein